MNVLLNADNVLKIADLGVSKFHQSNSGGFSSDSPNISLKKENLRTQGSQDNIIASRQGRVGTPLYLSPEVVKQLPYDYKIDTWAIGC